MKGEEVTTTITERTKEDTPDDIFNDTLVVTALTADRKEEDEGKVKNSMSRFTRECLGSGVLDSACNSNVCGQGWMEHYTANLSATQWEKIKSVENSEKRFVFGNMGLLRT